MVRDSIDKLRRRATVEFTVDEAGLERALAERDDQRSSTAVRVLSGIGGFFASLLFLLFLWLSDLLNAPDATFVLGLALVGGTILLGRHRRQAFLATVTICGYLVGVGLVLSSLPYAGAADYLPVVPTVIIAVATLLVTRNYFLVFLAVLSLPACLLYLHLARYGPWLVDAAVLLSAGALCLTAFFEHRFLADRRYTAVRSGLVLGLLMCLVYYRWMFWLTPRLDVFLGEWVIGGGLYLLTVATISFALGRRWAAGLGVVLLPLVLLPLLLGSLLILLLGYRNRHFLGVATGVMGLVYFTAQYYYDLRWDLLNKSLVLMASGALLLVAYFLQRKLLSDATT